MEPNAAHAALLGFLCFLWCLNQQRFAQEAALYRLQASQRSMDYVSLYMRRMQQYRKRRRRARDSDVLLWIHRRRARSIWTQPRACSWWLLVNDNWEDRDWQRNFRMRRASFMHLCEILRPSLTRQNTHYRCPVPVELRVAICVWRLATNLAFKSISHLFGVGVSTACMIVQEVVTSINRVMQRQYIKTPSEAELRLIVQGFKDKWGFPQAAGAIDSAHVGILAPEEHAADYYNRKGFYSVVLQGVVDHNLKFWDINVGWPGKVHDAKILENSSLYLRGQNGTLLPSWTERLDDVDVPLLILADAAYPLRPWLLKPFPEGEGATQAQTTFNRRLAQARTAVDRAFVRLKGRWRILKKCNAHISLVSHIISACCVLHNFCEIYGEEWDDEGACTDDDVVVFEAETDHQPKQGDHIRNALCSYFQQ